MACAPIVFVMPFEALAETALAIASEWGTEVSARVGDLDKGVEEAVEAVARGAEVIISRGGTASMIAAAVHVPVVEIRVTSSDVLRAFHRLGQFQGKVGLAGFRNVIYGCEEVGQYLGLEIVQIQVASQSEAAAVMEEAVSRGVQQVIGDHISHLVARQMGMRSILIDSGREGIAQALFEAQHVLRVRREERSRGEQIRTILDSVQDGILAVDRDGRVIIFNPSAERVFGLKAAEVLGREVADVIPNTRLHRVLSTGQTEVGEIQRVGAIRLAATRVPVRVGGEIVGAVATFHDVTELQRYEQLVRQKLHRKGLVARSALEQIVGSSPAVRRLVEEARRYANSTATVLICGESGTGKELVAQGIHLASPRRQGPFVAINCAALPETLLESELFGYEEGAFTGARRGGKQGLFELAHGGTIFLDEIGEMPLSLQARLLRVLQEKEIMRIGAEQVLPVDLRVIAATNRRLEEEVAAGRFRPDLFYRLDILRLEVPPLRERLDDIPVLVAALAARLQEKYGRPVTLAPAGLAALYGYGWPGNIRELESFLERLSLVCSENPIGEEAVRAHLPRQPEPAATADFAWPQHLTLAQLEELAIRRALQLEQGNQQRAAARLGLHRSTLYRKMQQNDAFRDNM